MSKIKKIKAKTKAKEEITIQKEVFVPPRRDERFEERLAELQQAYEEDDMDKVESVVFRPSKSKKKEQEKEPKPVESKFLRIRSASKFITLNESPVPASNIDYVVESLLDAQRHLEDDKLGQLAMSAKVVSVKNDTKKSFTKDLSRKIRRLRRFIVEEIAPLNIAIDSAFDQAYQELSLILETDDGSLEMGSDEYVNLLRDAIRAKMFVFLCEELGCPDSMADLLIRKHLGVLNEKLPDVQKVYQV